MQHLTLEELARLQDEALTEEAAAHLGACEECAAELAALREQTAKLAILRRAAPPGGVWATVEGELRRDGLMAGGGRPGWSWPVRAAAAVSLFLLGSLSGGTFVTYAGGDEAADGPRSAEEAAALLAAAEADYFRAVSDYAALADGMEAVDPINRLAALEGILLTTGAALREAPADPVINNYHMTALGMRDALMRQISQVEGEEWY